MSDTIYKAIMFLLEYELDTRAEASRCADNVRAAALAQRAAEMGKVITELRTVAKESA